jgi:hypothetical protein
MSIPNRLVRPMNNVTSEKPRWRLAAAVVLLSLVYTGLVLGNGLDRLSETRPELATKIPSLFASEALRIAGAQALSAGQALSTVKLGQQALRDAPTDPQSAAMLGAGLLGGGNQAKADRAFRVAGRLGWRVPITQSYWLSKALAVSDYRLAALHLDALGRQQPSLITERQLLDPMERNPAGRAALISRMALHPEWLPSYVGVDASTPADALLQRSVVLEEAARAGVVLGCETITPMVRRLAELKRRDEAARLWTAHCPASERALVTNPPI